MDARVRSARSSNEKTPWKGLKSLEGVIEKRFLRSVHLGSTIVGFRSRSPRLAVIPELDGTLLDSKDDRIEDFPGLSEWWQRAEGAWEEHHSAATRLGLKEQIDYHSKMTNQFPTPRHRVVYTASGQHLAACRLDDPEALVEKALFWGAVASVEEGRFLCAILNSERLAQAVRPLQARGQHNPRHFDMHIFSVAIPLFDPSEPLHVDLASLAERAEQVVAGLELDPNRRIPERPPGCGPAPSILKPGRSSDDVADDVSGSCDEAEHASDPGCAGTPPGRRPRLPTACDDATSTAAPGGTASGGHEVRSLDAAGAGTVIYAVDGGSLRLVTATPASGWGPRGRAERRPRDRARLPVRHPAGAGERRDRGRSGPRARPHP